MIKLGIDISKHNKVTSWDMVSQNHHVQFVILRAGGDYNGKYKDSKFEQYYNACKNYGIPVGAYYDCGKEFYTYNKGISCAKHFKELLTGKQFEYPVYMDIEVTPTKYRELITDAAYGFCKEMESYKYYVGIYASDISGFKEALNINRLTYFDKWVARYGKAPSYVKDHGIWQYSSKGFINGIAGDVDLDKCYRNYEKIIKGAHLNGY